MPKEGKVIVKGVSVATKHQKARKQGQESSIIKVETPIYACKVMVVCPKCNKPTPRRPQGRRGRQEGSRLQALRRRAVRRVRA